MFKSTGKKLRQELDLYYDDGQGEIICIEFKFHRTGCVSSTFAHTDAAGRIINDLRRLQLIQASSNVPIKRLLVYVTDDEMHNYLANTAHSSQNKKYRTALSSFYQNGSLLCPVSSVPKIFPTTFYDCANSSFNGTSTINISAVKVFDQSFSNPSCPSLLNGNCHISIFEIQSNTTKNNENND